MNELFLSETMIARAFWNELRSSTRADDAVAETYAVFEYSDLIAKSFPNQTGSMSRTSMLLLWLMARYFEPQHIAEVGTFIGRSTMSLYRGAKPSLVSMATCDLTYDCWRAPDLEAQALIRYFGKTPSTVMFQQLLAEGKKIDLFFVDGRISAEDLSLIERLRNKNSIFVLDDFEGIEKGVSCAVQLRERFNDLLLLVPDVDIRMGWNDCNFLAVLVPMSCLRLTRQQRLPLGLM